MIDKNELQTHADGIITRAKNILTAPDATWEVIKGETDQPMSVFLKYALPLIAIGPIATFLGGLIFGYGGMFGVSIRPGFGFLLSTMVTTLVLSLLSVWLLAFIANLVSKQFEGRDDFPAAFRLVAYSMTAAWLAGIFNLIPALGILTILGLYSLYLIYKGASPIMGVPEEKSVVYTIVVIVAAIIANFVIGMLSLAITGPAMLAGAGMGIGAADGNGDFNMDVETGYGNVQIKEEDGKATINVGGTEMTIDIPEDEDTSE